MPEQAVEIVDRDMIGSQERGGKVVADHEPRAFVELLAVAGLDVGDALPPPLPFVGLDPHEHALLRGRRAEARAERPHQRQPDQAQLDVRTVLTPSASEASR